jgi:hypothetical protein
MQTSYKIHEYKRKEKDKQKSVKDDSKKFSQNNLRPKNLRSTTTWIKFLRQSTEET